MKNKIDRWDISLINIFEIVKVNLKKEYSETLYNFLYESEFSKSFKKDERKDMVKTVGGMKITYKYTDVLTLRGNELVSFEDIYLNEINKYDNFIEEYNKKLNGFTLANLVTFKLNMGERENLNKKELLLTELIIKEVFSNCTLELKRDFKSFIILLENYYKTYSLGKCVEQESIEKIIKKDLLVGCGIRGRDELLGVINVDYYDMVRNNNDKSYDLKKEESLNKNKVVNIEYLEDMIKNVCGVEPYKNNLLANKEFFKSSIVRLLTENGLNLKKQDYINELFFGLKDKEDIVERVVKRLFENSDQRVIASNIVRYIEKNKEVSNDNWKILIDKNLDSMKNNNKYLMYYYLIREPNNIFKRKGISIGNSGSEDNYEPLLKIVETDNEKLLTFNPKFEIYNGYRFKNNSEHLGLYFNNLETFLSQEFIERGEIVKEENIYEIVLESSSDKKRRSKEEEADLILKIKEVIKSCINPQQESLEDVLNRVEKIKMEKDISDLNINKKTKKLKF